MPPAHVAPSEAAAECQRLGGSLPRTDDPRAVIIAGRDVVTVTLPGSGWCEVGMGSVGAARRVFINVTPRVVLLQQRPDARPEEMHAFIVQVGAWSPGPAGGDLATGRQRLVETVAREMTAPAPSGEHAWMALPRLIGRAPEIGPIDGATHCFPMTHAGTVPGAGRQFEMDARFCQLPTMQATVMIMTLQEWTPGDAVAVQRAAGFRVTVSRIFQSLRVVSVADLPGAAR